MKIPFSPPYIDEAVINEVVDSLKSGWITSGPKVKALEEEIKKFSNAKEVLCVNSWTSGAIMMLRWLGVTAEDEVIVPAYTYSATALAVLHAGAKPVMVDSGEDFNISVDAIRKAITPRTKAIIPVDIAGFPCDYDRIMRLVNEPEIRNQFQATSLVQEKLGRILVMNDAAHSLGAYYNKNQRTGCETDIAIFSLHAVKNVTTAEGGAICLNLPEPFDNAELYKELRMMSLNCQTKDAFSKSKAGGWRYDIVGLGMKINMADVNAAIGLAQIREYPELLKERKRVFNTYSKAFADCDWAILPPSEDGEKESSYHIYALRVKDFTEEQRDRMIDEIAKSEVAVNVHFIPMPMLSFFSSLGYDIKNYPQAYENFKGEISLPIYPQLDEEKLDFIIKTVKDAYLKVKYDVMIPFIRQVSGPMDYTQGAMRNASKGNYYPCNSEPMSQGTRCRQLALYVVFESPFNMLCDNPSNYMREPESTDFIAAIPTVWDESIVLDGKMGEYIVTARRKGDVWYIGGITDWTARDIEVDCSFLGDKAYNATLFKDGVNAHRVGRDYKRESVKKDSKLKIHLAPGGGFALQIK